MTSSAVTDGICAGVAGSPVPVWNIRIVWNAFAPVPVPVVKSPYMSIVRGDPWMNALFLRRSGSCSRGMKPQSSRPRAPTGQPVFATSLPHTACNMPSEVPK